MRENNQNQKYKKDIATDHTNNIMLILWITARLLKISC